MTCDAVPHHRLNRHNVYSLVCRITVVCSWPGHFQFEADAIRMHCLLFCLQMEIGHSGGSGRPAGITARRAALLNVVVVESRCEHDCASMLVAMVPRSARDQES